jgi:hypothetical protein
MDEKSLIQHMLSSRLNRPETGFGCSSDVTGIGEPFHCSVVTSPTLLYGKPFNFLKRTHPDPDLSEIAG